MASLSVTTAGILAGFLAFAPGAEAQLYCSKPIRPYCTTIAEPFSGASETRECSEEIEDFDRAASTYRDCLQDQIEKSNRLSRQVSDGFLSRNPIKPSLEGES